MALNRSNWPKYEVRARDDWHVGLDVGQSIDPNALCVLNHKVTPGDWSCDDARRVWRHRCPIPSKSTTSQGSCSAIPSRARARHSRLTTPAAVDRWLIYLNVRDFNRSAF